MDIDILGISEMNWLGSGHFRSANNTVLYSGHSSQREWHGNDHNKPNVAVTYRLQGSKRQNHIYIRMKAHLVNITCVQVYAPTTSTETADIEELNRNRHSTLNEVPRKDVLIIMGDWNTKIAKGEEPGMVGKYGLGNRNEAGERLLEFCDENALFLANTYFEKPEQRLYTWTSPDGQYRNQIDYTVYSAEDDGEVLFSQ